MGSGRVTGGFNSSRFFVFNNFSTTPTVTGAATLTMDQTTKTSIKKNDKAQYTITWDSTKNDKDLHDRIRSWINVNAAGLEDIRFNDGSVISGASINQNLFVIVDGAIDTTSGSPSYGFREFYAGAVAIKATSGGYDEEAAKWNRVAFEADSIPLNASFTVPTTLFPTTIYTAAAFYTISYANRYGVIDFM